MTDAAKTRTGPRAPFLPAVLHLRIAIPSWRRPAEASDETEETAPLSREEMQALFAPELDRPVGQRSRPLRLDEHERAVARRIRETLSPFHGKPGRVAR